MVFSPLLLLSDALCRCCRHQLFYETQLQPHVPKGGPLGAPPRKCTSAFVEPLQWMKGLQEQQGKLLCPNPSVCTAALSNQLPLLLVLLVLPPVLPLLLLLLLLLQSLAPVAADTTPSLYWLSACLLREHRTELISMVLVIVHAVRSQARQLELVGPQVLLRPMERPSIPSKPKFKALNPRP